MIRQLVYHSSAHKDHALQLAHSLSIQAVELQQLSDPDEIVLFLDDTGIGLGTYRKQKRFSTVMVDFTTGKSRHRRIFGNNKDSDLVAAIGSSTCTILDATAGLGQDSYILASLGCSVTLCERNPIIRTLLQDGLRRGTACPETAGVIANMTLLPTDALLVLSQLADSRLTDKQPDVIYLDPMYPERNKSALVKKEMRWLRSCVGDDLDAAAVLEHALPVAKNRVVVKRMKNAPLLGNQEPSCSVAGKTVRFDIYHRE